MVFDERLRAHRRRSGLSQEGLADKAGVDVKTIRDIENGRRRPRPSTMRQLADALGLDDAVRSQFYEAAAAEVSEVSEVSVVSLRRSAVVPAQLPLGVLGFTGRSAQIRGLDLFAESAWAQPT